MNIKLISYFREVLEELGKVTWPNRNEVLKMSLTVFIVSGVIAAFISGMDIFFAEFISRLINLQF